MKAIASVTLLVFSLVIPPAHVLERSPQAEVMSLVRAARQAMGGPAALDAITSLAISGTFTRNFGPTVTSSSFETSCILPDKFIRVSRRTTGGMMSFEITDYEGFDGDRAIRDTVAPNATIPVTIPGPPPATQQEADDWRAKQLDGLRRLFLQIAVPLFVTTPAVYGLELLPGGGKVPAGSGQADVIIVRHQTGAIWRLMLDEQTHLPVQITWSAKPLVSFSTSSVTSSRGGAPPAPVSIPTGDPTVGLADVEWAISIRDYKVADGLNWPRRFSTTVAGKTYEDVRVSRYRLNPKIDPKVFEPHR